MVALQCLCVTGIFVLENHLYESGKGNGKKIRRGWNVFRNIIGALEHSYVKTR